VVAILALGAAVLVILVLVGRRPGLLRQPQRLARGFFAALAAGAAVVAGLRGAWIASLALIALSAWIGVGLRRSEPPAVTGAMSLEQARSILGVGAGASPAEIEAAYRQLIRRAHPDVGGTSGLAAQLNAARARLLK
jgi:hypothetical protein